MSFDPKVCSSREFRWGILLLLSVALVSTVSFAQDQPVPKVDVFTGYQWLHPGGNVPSPLGIPSNPISQTLPDLGSGVVGDATYNFNRVLGLSLD